MNTQQLDAAMRIAQDGNERLDNEDQSIFDGFGLPNYKGCTCTVRQLAALIRWQCFQLNGKVDAEAFQQIADIGRHKFTVVGEGSGVAEEGLKRLEALARRAVRHVGAANYEIREKQALAAVELGFTAYREGRFNDIDDAWDDSLCRVIPND